MSVAGSDFSYCSTASRSSSREDEGSTLAQKCVELRDFLGLDAYITKKTDVLPRFDRRFQISSRTLKENYVLPDDSAVNVVFQKLAALVADCAKRGVKVPKTDFTCMSRDDKRKVWIDVDCMRCKNGCRMENARHHFKITSLVKIIVDTVASFFQIPVDKGVYLTNGGDTCGFHLFFNTLAYDADTHEEKAAALMDALLIAFRQHKKITEHADVDRGCTQMPLPTASHSGSRKQTKPYRMQKSDGKWEKVRLRWTQMDVETLKCFSSLAFSNHYTVENDMTRSTSPPCFKLPESRSAPKRSAAAAIAARDDDVKKARISSNDAEPESAATVARDDKPVDSDRRSITEEEPTEPASAPKRSAMAAAIVDRDDDVKKARTDTKPPPDCGDRCIVTTTTTLSPQSDDPIGTLSNDEDEDDVSLVSKITDSSLASSYVFANAKNGHTRPETFAVPAAPVPRHTRKKLQPPSKHPPRSSRITIDRLPYACEDDKTSVFTDKRYKAALLCAEEEAAAVSKARLGNENAGRENRRVYVMEGSGSSVAREYKLLVQLANVDRGVYQDDILSVREWADLLVFYYVDHLWNPVLLEMLKFVFQDVDVVALFTNAELQVITTSVVYLMTPFKVNAEEDGYDEALFKMGARHHMVKVVGALIRICTHLFDMTTAVFSDLWKIQKRKEKKDVSTLNRTVVNSRVFQSPPRPEPKIYRAEDEDELDCAAAMVQGTASGCESSSGVMNNYMLLASLIVHEQTNLSDMSLYALLYYYHSFTFDALDRITNEIHHEGLMVTAAIRYFLMYDRKGGKMLTLQEIYEGFNDCAISLKGPEGFLKMRRKTSRKQGGGGGGGGEAAAVPRNKDPDWKRRRNGKKPDSQQTETRRESDSPTTPPPKTPSGASKGTTVTQEEIERLLGAGCGSRRRKMCGGGGGADRRTADELYEYKDKDMWVAVINYYLRPVFIYDDKMVFANDNYDTLEEDAVESGVAHLALSNKITKGDVQTAFKDARTAWRMPHGSQLIYESDLRSDRLGCCFHINVALKMYEMFCGGCVTRMKRVHRNYLIDRTRFNMTVYDVVAECKTATVDLTAAVDRSYVNLLLRQPVVPPFLEDKEDVRRLFMCGEEIERGSFCCLSIMDYRRALDLFEKTNYKCKSELDTCEYVEKFLNDLYTNEIAAEHAPNHAANNKMRVLYAFYTLYLFEVVFNMRHVYVKRENISVSVERLSNELDIRELIILFFGESSMKQVDGLDAGIQQGIRATADEWTNNNKRSARGGGAEDESLSEAGAAACGRFDVRTVFAADVPDKVARMKTLFGQFGFEVMQDSTMTMEDDATNEAYAGGGGSAEYIDQTDGDSRASGDSGGSSASGSKIWDDDTRFESEFYAAADWLDKLNERLLNKKITGKSNGRKPALSGSGGHDSLFARETLRTIMRLEAKRHVDHDRLGKLTDAAVGASVASFESVMVSVKRLPLRLKLLAFILTTHTVKLKTKSLCPDLVESQYREADGRFADERRVYEGEINNASAEDEEGIPPEKMWRRRTETLLADRLPLLLHARWLSEQRFKTCFFVGLDPVRVYSALYEYMTDNADSYPSFREFNRRDANTAKHLCTAMMFLLIMSAYDQDHVDLYLKVFLAVEWPGQWAKTIFVWKSNSNAGKSYLFDAIVKRACANSTCINDPKGGKENAPEKAEYVRNFVLFANEFSQANSNELKKIVSESTFKFRMNYGNVMNEAYATGKIMFNCNTLPPTSDEAAINRLTLFDIPFWFSKRQPISDAMLNWIRGPGGSGALDRWEIAYRHQLPSLLTAEEKAYLKSNGDTKDEKDLFDEDAAVRRCALATEYNKPASSLFLVQNKTSRQYVASSPPTDAIVRGLVNITSHFSWLRFFKRLDMPVDFTTLPASSEAVRSEWLSQTLPYQEWKLMTGAKTDTTRVTADSVHRSLQAFAAKKNTNYFAIKQFFESDFASARVKDEYYLSFDTKAFRE